MFRAGTHPDYLEHLGTIKIGDGTGRADEELTARDLVRSRCAPRLPRSGAGDVAGGCRFRDVGRSERIAEVF